MSDIPAHERHTPMTRSAELLQAADPAGALQALSEEVRARPGDARLRVFMAQLLCVLGQWERALNQLCLLYTSPSPRD